MQSLRGASLEARIVCDGRFGMEIKVRHFRLRLWQGLIRNALHGMNSRYRSINDPLGDRFPWAESAARLATRSLSTDARQPRTLFARPPVSRRYLFAIKARQ